MFSVELFTASLFLQMHLFITLVTPKLSFFGKLIKNVFFVIFFTN